MNIFFQSPLIDLSETLLLATLSEFWSWEMCKLSMGARLQLCEAPIVHDSLNKLH